MKDRLTQHRHLQHHHHQMSHSDEVDRSRISGENKKQPRTPDQQKDRTGGEGSTVGVVKRPRGRPPGSKNKPKPPVVITNEAEPSAEMQPHVLEIPAGQDVVDSLAGFSRLGNLGVCVLSGTGAVANVTLRQPQLGGPPLSSATPATIFFHGRFNILSISATFLPPATAALSPAAATGLSITLAGPQGQIVGGTVAGPLVTAGTVMVVAATFSNPTFYRLPMEDEEVSLSVSVSASGCDRRDMDPEHEQHLFSQHQEHRQRLQQEPVTTEAESCGISIYSGQVPSSDVIWAPIARLPPPPF